MLYYNDTMNKGANPLPAHGRAGARTTPFLAALFAKQKTKFGGGGTPVVERFAFTTGQEARAGKNSFPPTPFPRTRTSSVRDFAFCPPERKLSKVSVRIFLKIGSDFNQKRQHYTIFSFFRLVFRLAASRLGAENGQISETFFALRAKKI